MKTVLRKILVFLFVSVMVLTCFGTSTFAEVLPSAGYNLLYGDVNVDGEITLSDALMLMRYCNGNCTLRSIQMFNADVNCDSYANTADAALIIQYISGTVTSLPVSGSGRRSNVDFSNKTFPRHGVRLPYGRSYALIGTVASDMPILSVSAKVVDINSGKVEIMEQVNFSASQGVMSYNTRSSLPSLDSKVKFASLSVGEKRIEVICSTTDDYNIPVYKSLFNVGFSYSELQGHVFAKNDKPDDSLARNVLDYLNELDLSSSNSGINVVSSGVLYLGTPYEDMDCSSFVRSAYRDALDVFLPRVSADQAKYCTEKGYDISVLDLQPGDVVFMRRANCDCGRYHEIHHAALFLGNINGKFYLMESTGSLNGVIIREIWGINSMTWQIDSFARPHN